MPNCKSINLNNDDNILRHNGEEAHEGNPAWTSEIGLELTSDEFSLSPRGAGYTFGAQVVRKFLE
ncbi:hypothetical protein KXX26_003223, partial [Aspergillus fumigatus]